MDDFSFASRHLGPRKTELKEMLESMGVSSMDELIRQAIPDTVRLDRPLELPQGKSEYEWLSRIERMASLNKIYKTYIGMGYYNTILPSPIRRNILENPSWYTSYTPYQAEISQGRLEALLNFQTVVSELTGMEIANSSLLDEAQSVAEAMIMMYNSRSRDAVKRGANQLFVDEKIYPQVLDVLLTRSAPLGIGLIVGDFREYENDGSVFGVIVQYPNSDGALFDYSGLTKKVHEDGALVAVSADLLSLCVLTPPGEWGADIVAGTTQRLGVPMAYGGPHAAYFATRDTLKRAMPGRIIGISLDSRGNKVYRLALQTREQHIKRERATSNICTAQALLAIMAGMYAVYHGPEGLKNIAGTIHRKAIQLNSALTAMGCVQLNEFFFDTLKIRLPEEISQDVFQEIALRHQINFRYFYPGEIGISLDETTADEDLKNILDVFAEALDLSTPEISVPDDEERVSFPFRRVSSFLRQPLFHAYRAESEFTRYIKSLERKDISLTHSMISLGSCTMKLNAASEMIPVTFTGFAAIHPFVPVEQAQGYQQLCCELERDLALITGFDAVSLQPDSGAAGEYSGLMVIREYHISRGEGHRNIVLIPSSAHGTNPASAVMAGMETVTVPCTSHGDIDLTALKELATQYASRLAAIMITYPSTHGIFESDIREIIESVHKNGGQVYMDGANMNAQVGLTHPGFLGADVCHLNLHKTFAIPHGGGGPGVGPICTARHLSRFLPSHAVIPTGGKDGITAVSAAPYGSAGILCVSHGYIQMMGRDLADATRYAILNANYLASALGKYYNVLYTNQNGRVAHEMILDCRPLKTGTEITETDIAKRLMDYGFHAPTLSFPVHGTLMIEPTESESLQELNRFVEAMVSILGEITEIKEGKADPLNNVLKNAPHAENTVISDQWDYPYGREKAAYPLAWIRQNKFWPGCSRVDDAYGDRNLVCSCPSS
ncbi:MAG: aminomethyl-transferring glycine dehydrogenase [Bacteroidales bacterium]|nr:aminomethyl-transferring glycine dehydrogenase [Bacteroidales bacterium]